MIAAEARGDLAYVVAPEHTGPTSRVRPGRPAPARPAAAHQPVRRSQV